MWCLRAQQRSGKPLHSVAALCDALHGGGVGHADEMLCVSAEIVTGNNGYMDRVQQLAAVFLAGEAGAADVDKEVTATP